MSYSAKMMTKPLKGKRFEDLIIHEDQDFIVINKPPFIATLQDRNDPQNILALAREYVEEARVCHRLDKETSGLLVIAKHLEAYKYFSGLLEHRDVHKLYHAVVAGRHEIEEEELDFPIYTTSNKSRVDFRQGKPSLTLIKTLHIYKAHTLLACMPFTGRMHQIRVHLAHVGLPISGDGPYGGEPIFLSQIKRGYKIGKFVEEQPLMPRMTLHAQKLIFDTPKGEKLQLEAPYPKDFAAVLKQFAKNL